MTQIDTDVWTGGRAAGHKRAAALQALHALIPGSRADVLDDDIDAFLIGDLADLFRDFLLVVVDPLVRAEDASLLQFAFVSGSRNNTALEHLGDLNCGNADARTSAEHKDSLAGSNLGTSNQHVPCGQENQGNARGIGKSKGVWDRNYIRCRYGDQFAISAIDGVAEHGEFAALILQPGHTLGTTTAEVHGGDENSLPGLKSADVFADFCDLSGDVAAEDVREQHTGQSFAHPKVQMVQGAGFHPYQNFIFAGLRIGYVFVRQNFRTTELMNAHCFHERDSFGPVRNLGASKISREVEEMS